MWLRLKQIACVAQQLAPVEQEICDILGLRVCFRDPGVSYFGLENALFPLGNQLLEVVAPTKEGTAAGRYLDRRCGDGGYMVITQCDYHPSRRAEVSSLPHSPPPPRRVQMSCRLVASALRMRRDLATS